MDRIASPPSCLQHLVLLNFASSSSPEHPFVAAERRTFDGMSDALLPQQSAAALHVVPHGHDVPVRPVRGRRGPATVPMRDGRVQRQGKGCASCPLLPKGLRRGCPVAICRAKPKGNLYAAHASMGLMANNVVWARWHLRGLPSRFLLPCPTFCQASNTSSVNLVTQGDNINTFDGEEWLVFSALH